MRPTPKSRMGKHDHDNSISVVDISGRRYWVTACMVIGSASSFSQTGNAYDNWQHSVLAGWAPHFINDIAKMTTELVIIDDA